MRVANVTYCAEKTQEVNELELIKHVQECIDTFFPQGTKHKVMRVCYWALGNFFIHQSVRMNDQTVDVKAMKFVVRKMKGTVQEFEVVLKRVTAHANP